MNYRRLGETGITVSEIGFGTWGIGGLTEGATSYGETDDAVSLQALDRAFDRGITFFDTSSTYGYGHAERLLGKAFAGRRDQVVIGTKAGCVRHGGPYDVSPKYLRESLERSLNDLGMDYVDLYQIHSVPLAIARSTPGVATTLRELKDEGLIRAFGYSTKTPEEALAAMREFGAEVIQVNFNLIDHRALTSGVLEEAAKRGVGVIARTPFAFGFLTGAIRSTDFDPRDHRSAWPKEQLELWRSAPERFAFLNPDGMYTPAQLALKFCVSFPEVSTVVPGMMTPEEVEENAAAGYLPPLKSHQLKEAALVTRELKFFLGK
jgi:aryl-alcohol dehydrogenase-like predicted oxidoreductase